MLESIVLPCLAALALCWSAVNFWRNQAAVAAGAAVMSLVVGLAFAASELRIDAWLEGGFGMAVLAIVGGYGLGCAVAHRRSKSPSSFLASLVAVGGLAVLSAVFFYHATSVPEAFLEGAEPEIRELILSAARGEAMRLLQLGTALGVATGMTLFVPPRAGEDALAPLIESSRSASSQSA
ncbi:MAG: hypothetical protein Q8N23_34880 [Archangium sp.]|nr:hypothetical protein [Archangium sp.]MDP3157908.1 hypothetical protein [Archangium sp.]MDP3571850.1 hypothetical protein [Archangium sp.]